MKKKRTARYIRVWLSTSDLQTLLLAGDAIDSYTRQGSDSAARDGVRLGRLIEKLNRAFRRAQPSNIP